MKIGKLRHRITLQTLSEVPNADYGIERTYTDVKALWALIDPLKGTVYFDTKQIEEGITHRIYIRNYPELTTEHWILHETRRFRIRSVRDIMERDRYIELLCEETFDTSDDYPAEQA